MNVSKNWLFQSFLNLFESLLLDEDTLESYNEKQTEANEKREINKKKKAMNNQKSERDGASESDEDEIRDQVLKRRSTKIEQKWYDVIEPKVINLLIQKFIMSLIWGFGAQLMTSARPAFNLFLHEQIDQVFSPAHCLFDFKKRLDMNLFPKLNCNLFSIFFTNDYL